MLVSYNWLQDYFEKKLPPPEKLRELLTMHIFEVDGMEEKGGDTIFDVKVLPDRAHYALSHFGIAYEISAMLGESVKPMGTTDVVIGTKAVPIITITDTSACRRYAGRIIENVGKAKTPKHILERLESIGQRSIHPIVDVANYVMYDVGQPLHAFDADKVKGPIQVRKALDGERAITLDNREVTLTSDMLVIADTEGSLAIAGIKGCKRAEIDAHTTRVILESANFESTTIRKTASRLGISTDASKRFENGYSPVGVLQGMNLFTKWLSDIFGSTLNIGTIVDVYPNKETEKKISTSINFLNERIGVVISEKEISDIFRRLQLSAIFDRGLIEVTIPAWRHDLELQEDLVDEIGRLYGYEKVPAEVPNHGTVEGVTKRFFVENAIRQMLAAHGFSEIMTSSFSSNGKLQIEKALASDKSWGRSNLSDAMEMSLRQNGGNAPLLGLDEIKLFELGRVWPTAKNEETHLVLGYASGRRKTKGVLITALKVVSDKIGFEISGTEKNGMVEIVLDEAFAKASIAEIVPVTEDLRVTFKPYSSYPFIVRDVALFVPENISEEMVWRVIEKGLGVAKSILANHSLFDRYIPKEGGKISYAFRLVFQSFDRTLTDSEINPLMESITSCVTKEGWHVR